MKKIGILLFVIVATTAYQSANAQAQLALGIKGGLNFANINTSASFGENYDNRTGYHAGAFLLVKFAKFGIQPELIYSAQGTKVKYSTGQSFDSNFSYVNIPVMLKLYLIGGLNLQAGPQFGFLTSAEGPKAAANGTLTTGDIKDQLKGSDISVGLGAGWDLPFGLTVDARYNLGVSDNSNSAGSQAIKNQVFQLSAGFKLIKFGK